MDFLSPIIFVFQENPWGQLIGFAALIASLSTFSSKNDRDFIIRMIISSAIWSAHFFAMGLLTAALINAVDIAKNALALKFPKNKYIGISVVIVYLIIAVVVWQGQEHWVILLPVVASIASTIVLFTLRGIWMRLAFLCILAAWMTYNFTGHSIGGFMTDSILFIAGIIGILRMESEK